MTQAFKICGLSLLLALALYIVFAAVIFDLGSPAPAFDQEYSSAGVPVAHGPLPRLIFCAGYYFDYPGGVGYSGEEWPFRVFMPVCRVWFLVTRYDPAS